MRYHGGKAKQAKWIESELLKLKTDQTIYLEPFMGSCSVLSRMAKHFPISVGTDIVPDVVMLWQELQRGWIPPKITEEEYKALKHAEPSALRAFAGFGCSYSGSWFLKWCGDTLNPSRPIQDQSRDSCLRRASSLKETLFECCSYDTHNPDSSYFVYCDPPYRTEYQNRYTAAPKFDHDLFWSTMDEWSDNGALVVVSEFSAPDNWIKLSSFQRPHLGNMERALRGDGKRGSQEEILFIRKH